MVSYDHLLLFILKIETTTRETNSMPFLVFRRDHLRSTTGMICGLGSFMVQFGDHFRLGIIYGRGSFAALYNTDRRVFWGITY